MNTEDTIAREFLKAHPIEAARVLEGVTVEDMAAFLESGGRGGAVAVLQNMESHNGARCLSRWSDAFVTDVLELVPITHTARMLRLMESADRERLLNLVTSEMKRALGSLLRYPEGTAGSRVNTLCVAYPQDLSVGETWKRLRRRRKPSGCYLYVVDPEGILVGALSFSELLSTHPRRYLRDIMSTPVESLTAFASGRAIVEHPGWQRFPDLPVVDESGVLLGSIRYSAFNELERSDGRGWSVLNVAMELGRLYWAGSSHILHGLVETVLTVSPGSATEEMTDEYGLDQSY
jgi:magnesium transporter